MPHKRSRWNATSPALLNKSLLVATGRMHMLFTCRLVGKP
jgi:hypothetical protein